MRSTRHLFVAAVVGATLLGSTLLGACSSKTTPAEFKAELIKAGLPEGMASCIETEMKSQNIEISNYTGMSAEESEKFTKLSTDCAAKEIGNITVPSISIPDVSVPK